MIHAATKALRTLGDWTRPPAGLAARFAAATFFLSDVFAAGMATPLDVAWAVAGCLAAALLVIGLATRWTALIALAVGGAAVAGVDAPGLWAIDQAPTFAFWELPVFAWLALGGGGPWSVDHGLARAKTTGTVVTGVETPDHGLASMAAAASRLLARLALGAGAVLACLGDPVTLAFGIAAAALLAAGMTTRLVAFAVAAGLAGVFVAGGGVPAGPLGLTLILAGFVVVHGPGRWSVDWVWRQDGPRRAPPKDAPRVVIVGAGFAGLEAAKTLLDEPVRVTIVARANHHLFQPLLYQVATAALTPADIATPIRELFRGARNVDVLMGGVESVDTAAKLIRVGERRLSYDYALFATGARHAYFGNDQWEAHAPGLKRLEDAVDMRNRLLRSFEMAEAACDAQERAAWQTVVIIGAGPTGVELAGSVAELAHHGMTFEFDEINPADTRIVLIDMADRALAALHPFAGAHAKTALEKDGVDVMLGVGATDIDEDGVTLTTGERIAAKTVFWAAGVQASPVGQWLGVDTNRRGQVPVGPTLEPEGLTDVFVAGDVAQTTNPDAKPVPGIAPAAKQAGKFAAKSIAARARGKRGPKRFRYRHYGDLATIGRGAGVADFGWLKLTGAPAWALWSVAHVYFLIGLRNRIAIALSWAWAFIT